MVYLEDIVSVSMPLMGSSFTKDLDLTQGKGRCVQDAVTATTTSMPLR